MFDKVIKLVAETQTTNKYGDTITTETVRNVYAEEKSISQSEFYQAQTAGLKPEIKFVIADFLDYQGEAILRYTPYGGVEEDYSIIRTYRDGIRLEIVCMRGIDK